MFDNVVLVCPRNDAESALIELIAMAMGIRTISSRQRVGATLEGEPILEQLIRLGREREVWIVEIPGPETEKRLVEAGFTVVLIDHHTYGDLDRMHAPDGTRQPSSLEQFLDRTQPSAEILGRCVGLPPEIAPRVARGLGIFDDRYAQGLRDTGYSAQEIRAVLTLRDSLIWSMTPSFDKDRQNARLAWDLREKRGGYTIVRAQNEFGVRGEIGIITIAEECDTEPLIIIEAGERAIYVQNVEPAIVNLLRERFPEPYNPFTFGANRCWGVDSTKKGQKAAANEVFAVLDI